MAKWTIETGAYGVALGTFDVADGDTVTPATDIELIIERINAGAYGYRVITAGAGWDSKYLWEDRDSSLCSPAPTKDIRATAAQLGII